MGDLPMSKAERDTRAYVKGSSSPVYVFAHPAWGGAVRVIGSGVAAPTHLERGTRPCWRKCAAACRWPRRFGGPAVASRVLRQVGLAFAHIDATNWNPADKDMRNSRANEVDVLHTAYLGPSGPAGSSSRPRIQAPARALSSAATDSRISVERASSSTARARARAPTRALRTVTARRRASALRDCNRSANIPR